MYDLSQGRLPLLISIPHLGTHIPTGLQTRYTPEALALADTDWHLDRLYAFADAIGASVLPPLFKGKLPVLDLGTNSGAACAHSVLNGVMAALGKAPSDLTHGVNGRIKGGYITRHYGQPSQGVHAIQLEKCQTLYMDEVPPFGYREDKSRTLAPLLQALAQVER